MLKKLFKKGRSAPLTPTRTTCIGAVADHDKGLAKEAMDLLYREAC
jgi:hypothetical protein